MGKREKTIERILNRQSVSYKEAENLLLHLGFSLKVNSSHHVFRKPGYLPTVSLKKRNELLPYQIDMLVEVLKHNGY